MSGMEAVKRTPRVEGGMSLKDRDAEDEVGEKMDGGIWGSLQDHVPLRLVWEKLPDEERSRLRVVCKAWNTSALQRLEAKPYFVTVALESLLHPLTCEFDDLLFFNGLFRYDVGSRELSFKRNVLPIDRVHVREHQPFAVEGLVFHYPGVYNLHTRLWHEVPEPPVTDSREPSVWGMMVDTTERPYTFKLVIGSTVMRTQIYDSRSRKWSITSSVVFEEATVALRSFGSYSCMCHNGCIYISLIPLFHFDTQFIDEGELSDERLLVYSVEEDCWSERGFPLGDVSLLPAATDCHRHSLGVWDGRIFAVMDMDGIFVWELVDAEKWEWAQYASCSRDMYCKLITVVGENTDMNHHAFKDLVNLSVLCDEYLLVCCWRLDLNRSDALVMFNLRTKEWEFVELPMRSTVSLEDHIEEEVHREDDVDVED